MSSGNADTAIASATRTGALEAWCNRLAHATLPSDYQILEDAGLASGHPWAFLADLALVQPGAVAYYRYLYGVAGLESPRHVLEIGTAFGLGGAAIIEGAVSYLAVRPGLAADAERYVAEVSRGGALPNVRLAAKLLPRWLLGKYRWESR